jgi:hypothetical protein
MEAVGKGNDIGPSGDLAREFECGFDRVGAGRSGELYPVIEASRRKDDALETFQKSPLGRCKEIETVGDAVPLDVIKEGLFISGSL